jgi:hypothetical protein
MAANEITEFGFRWGPVEVTRIGQYEGSVWLQLKTQRKILEVRVTPSGLLRFHEKKSNAD